MCFEYSEGFAPSSLEELLWRKASLKEIFDVEDLLCDSKSASGEDLLCEACLASKKHGSLEEIYDVEDLLRRSKRSTIRSASGEGATAFREVPASREILGRPTQTI